MRLRLPSQLAELPAPAVDSAPWLSLIREFPKEWRSMVWLACREPGGPSAPSTCTTDEPALACDDCGITFRSDKALRQHQRIKHSVRSEWRLFIGADATCPCCKTQFSTRLRGIAHLTDQRRNDKCRAWCLNCGVRRLSPAEATALDSEDAARRAAAHKEGRTTPLSVRAPTRARARLQHTLFLHGVFA